MTHIVGQGCGVSNIGPGEFGLAISEIEVGDGRSDYRVDLRLARRMEL